MNTYISRGQNPHDLPKRAVRALTEKMTVLPETGRAKGAADLYLVVSESGSEYLVDTREGRCDCPDAHYNLDPEERCKHESRVNYATGQMPIPEWVNVDAIDPLLGKHTDATVFETKRPALSVSTPAEGTTTVQTDGGMKSDKVAETAASGDTSTAAPTYTYHRESPYVGGARYVRCTECEAECIPAKPAKMLHHDGCSEGQR